ncbi:MAG: hypothetical protein ABSB35_30095 [Bryobacteraceae bacterium]|jgi:hypothetical protein
MGFGTPAAGSFPGFGPFATSFSTTKLGVNGGGGVSMRFGNSRAKFFAEARYNQMYTRPVTSFIPVTFGIKW